MIIIHLIYDTHSLLACSLTCYSWYISIVPHLHHTLTISTNPFKKRKLMWPYPLMYTYRLGLLPLVKKLRIREGYNTDIYGLSSQHLNPRLLHLFRALKQVQELEIDYLDIPTLMPRIRQCFGHFLPTLRSLCLREPKGCHRQIIYFIGSFRHLEDLKLPFSYARYHLRWEPRNDLTLFPPFAPPLRGRLMVTFLERAGFLEEMIELFGGIRFRRMDLFYVGGISLLLGACAETLETLRFYPTDVCGEQLCLNNMEVLANDFTAKSYIRNFDLSRNKSLQTLEVGAGSVDRALGGGSLNPTSSLLKHMLSTITSPAFSEVIVIHYGCDFSRLRWASWSNIFDPFRRMSQAERAEEALRHHMQFKLFCEAQKVRDFQFVLCADVWSDLAEYTMRVLREAVAAEKAKGLFDDFSSEPIVIHRPRTVSAEIRDEIRIAYSDS